MRPELELISEWIRPGARVLDLGCGDGALLAYLHALGRSAVMGWKSTPPTWSNVSRPE
jgi:2-polyprenyl-3-methyl-5-hydroxy-6-metoxy-1,4-benzoquinol methylase